jgi:hypothetical protein
MYILFINLLLLSALFDSRYHKLRFDTLIVLLFISIILWIDNSNKIELITDILFITLFFSVFYISNNFFYKIKPFYEKTSPTILSLGDKILFLSLMLFSGVENGVIIILFGLFTTLLWVNVTRKYFVQRGYQRRTIPFYPFMTFSLIIIGVING